MSRPLIVILNPKALYQAMHMKFTMYILTLCLKILCTTCWAWGAPIEWHLYTTGDSYWTYGTYTNGIQWASGTSIKGKLLCQPEINCSHIHPARLMKSTHRGLIGFCVFIGVPKSVIGMKELNSILTAKKQFYVPRYPSNQRFRFGDKSYQSVGMVTYCTN